MNKSVYHLFCINAYSILNRAYDKDNTSERTSKQKSEKVKRKEGQRERAWVKESDRIFFLPWNDCRGVVWMRQKHKHHLKHMLRCATLTTRKFIGFRSQIKIGVTTIQKRRKNMRIYCTEARYFFSLIYNSFVSSPYKKIIQTHIVADGNKICFYIVDKIPSDG